MKQDPSKAYEETLDRIAGDWYVYQYRYGHRFSTDDLAVAWRALENRPQTTRFLELGSGIGSAHTSLLYALQLRGVHATAVAVEAQALSARLCRRSHERNGLTERVELHVADFRNFQCDEKFSLVMGTPPYFPVGQGAISPHPQRAGARMELRGSVFDYAKTAARFLAPDGRYVFVMRGDDPRTEASPAAAGLVVEEELRIRFAPHKPANLLVLTCGWPDDVSEKRSFELLIRDANREWTPEYLAFRKVMGAP